MQVFHKFGQACNRLQLDSAVPEMRGHIDFNIETFSINPKHLLLVTKVTQGYIVIAIHKSMRKTTKGVKVKNDLLLQQPLKSLPLHVTTSQQYRAA